MEQRPTIRREELRPCVVPLRRCRVLQTV
jgi:hypothetical protein